MTTTEINALLVLRRKAIPSLKDLAKAISTPEQPICREQVSATINYTRENAHIRQLIADYLGMPVDELFDPFEVHANKQRAA